MKFFKKTVVAALLAVAMIIPNGAAFAAGVTVTLNGNPLKFTLIDPLIINDRAMVPIRETAEFLGMTVDWDDKTGIMTCVSKEGDVISHKLYQNSITVNGVLSAFDTPSQIVNDRTVMPVRMLAEATGAFVDWDGKTSTVIIIKDGVTAPPAATSSPSISTVTTGTANASPGIAVMFNVVASAGTEKIQVLNGTSGNVVATSSTGTTSGESKIFTVSYTPNTSFQTMTLNFLPIGSDGVSGPPRLYTLKGNVPADTNTGVPATPGVGAADIISIDVDDNSIKLNDTVEVTVMTNNTTEKVAVYDVNRNLLASRTTYFIDGNQRRFELEIKPEKSGNVTMDVEATGRDGKKVTDEFDLNITKNGSSSSSSSGNGWIIDVDVDDETVSEGDEVEITMVTDDTVERVWVALDNDNIEETYDYEEDDDEFTWEFSFDADESGYYRFYAENDDGDEDYWVIPITVDGDDEFMEDDYQIEDAETDENSYDDGDDIEVTVTTGIGAEDVWIEFDGDDMNASVEYYYDDDEKKWTLTFDADVDNDGEYTVYSESYGGDDDEYPLDIEIDD